MNKQPVSNFLPMPTFLNPSWLFTKTILEIVLTIFFIGYAVISGVLFYHWSEYGMGDHGFIIAKVFFIVVSLLLFIFAGMALSYM